MSRAIADLLGITKAHEVNKDGIKGFIRGFFFLPAGMAYHIGSPYNYAFCDNRMCESGSTEKTLFSITRLVFSVIGTVVILIVTAIVLPDQIKMYNHTVGAFKRGDYNAVEGFVENFHPMPKEGHDSESFSINGIPFEYGYTISFGYHKVKSDGGVITGNGQHLRIGYTCYNWLGNVIVYIEEIP